MDVTLSTSLAHLRCAVGYLGERGQFGWWQSSFFAPASRAFLAPVFARSTVMAQCAGVTRASGVVHDERIGVGRVYHLFRLPEDLEQSIHRAFKDPDHGTHITAVTASKDAALAYLRRTATSAVVPGIGPTLVGDARALRRADTWGVVAAHYLQAFDANQQVFPYLVDKE